MAAAWADGDVEEIATAAATAAMIDFILLTSVLLATHEAGGMQSRSACPTPYGRRACDLNGGVRSWREPPRCRTLATATWRERGGCKNEIRGITMDRANCALPCNACDYVPGRT